MSEDVIEITEEDLQSESGGTEKLNNPLWIHPIEREAEKKFLRERLPADLANRVISCRKPVLSSAPDTKEIQEARKSRNRKEMVEMDGQPVEDVGAYTLRVLYEEAFGVLPVETFGGLITHYGRGSLGETLNIIRGIDEGITALPVEEAISRFKVLLIDEREKDSPDFFETIKDIESIGKPDLQPSRVLPVPSVINHPQSLLKGLSAEPIRRGWSLLQAYSLYESNFNDLIKDERLRDEFGLDSNTSVKDALDGVYYQVRKPDGFVFQDEKGHFREKGDEKYNEGLRRLAVLRTSPDFAFLFNHYSAVGAINERVNVSGPEAEVR